MLVFSAYFSGSEMALNASNKLMLEINRKHFPRLSKITDVLVNNSGVVISTILVGNNIALVVYGLAFGRLFSPAFTQYVSDNATALLLTQTVISTIIIIIFGEFLPKTLIHINPSTMLSVLSVPMIFFYYLFYPIGKSMQWLSKGVIRVFFRSGSTSTKADQVPGRIDLNSLLEAQAETESKGEDIAQEARLMKNTLDFRDTKVRDCFKPRNEIVALSIDDTVAELKRRFISTGLSKILIYDDNIDNIIGYVHVSALFNKVSSIRDVMQQILVVPETMNANALFKQFTSQHKSIALVVDELGGTAGIVTLEDVLEEIFGEIADEHDQVAYEETVIDGNEFVFSGRLELDYLNEKYNLKLPTSDDYDTLAGLILNINESIPQTGEVITTECFRFDILAATNAKIEKVKITVLSS